MINLRVIGLDPGGTTGWATLSAAVMPAVGSMPAEIHDPTWTCGMFGPGEHHSQLYTFLELQTVENTHIVCESFEFRQKVRDNVELVSREYIGVTRLFSQERQVPLHMQTASMGKITPNGLVKKTNLQKLGLWSSGPAHPMDAYGHLLYWVISGKAAPEHIKHWARGTLLPKGWM